MKKTSTNVKNGKSVFCILEAIDAKNFNKKKAQCLEYFKSSKKAKLSITQR